MSNILGDISKIDVPRRSRGSSSAEFDTEMYNQNLPKMAVLLSDDIQEIQVDEGAQVSLEFTVQNKSEMTWPFKPLV